MRQPFILVRKGSRGHHFLPSRLMFIYLCPGHPLASAVAWSVRRLVINILGGQMMRLRCGFPSTWSRPCTSLHKSRRIGELRASSAVAVEHPGPGPERRHLITIIQSPVHKHGAVRGVVLMPLAGTSGPVHPAWRRWEARFCTRCSFLFNRTRGKTCALKRACVNRQGCSRSFHGASVQIFICCVHS